MYVLRYRYATIEKLKWDSRNKLIDEKYKLAEN